MLTRQIFIGTSEDDPIYLYCLLIQSLTEYFSVAFHSYLSIYPSYEHDNELEEKVLSGHKGAERIQFHGGQTERGDTSMPTMTCNLQVEMHLLLSIKTH